MSPRWDRKDLWWWHWRGKDADRGEEPGLPGMAGTQKPRKSGPDAEKSGARNDVGSGVEEFFEEEAGEAAGVVAEDAVFLEEIVEDDAEAEFLEGGEVDGYRFGALGTVAAGYVGGDGLAIGDNPIDDAAGDVFLDGAEMVGEGVAGGFAGLGHQIGDVDARRFGFSNGGGNFRD